MVKWSTMAQVSFVCLDQSGVVTQSDSALLSAPRVVQDEKLLFLKGGYYEANIYFGH